MAKPRRAPPPSLAQIPRGMQPGHRLQWLADPSQAWQALLAALAQARRSIDIQLYMLQDDAFGRAFTAALVQARQRGVAVRLMLDGFGSIDLPDSALTELLGAGAELRVFRPIWLSVPGGVAALWHHWMRRNHRKVFIFDGESAIVTGRNVGAHYYGSDPAETWLDLGVWVHGPVVKRLSAALQRDWADRQRRTGRMIALRQHVAKLLGSPIARAEARSLGHGHAPRSAAQPQSVANGPAVGALLNLGQRRAAHANRAYLQAVRAARHAIWLAHSYFLPERALQRALVAAARRGVRVVVLLPDPAVSDVKVVALASLHGLPKLLAAGVEVYFVGPTMLHAKVGVVDGQWWTLGSANLDPLSRQHNLEANLAGLGQAEAGRLVELLDQWRQQSQRWTLQHHLQRPVWQRLIGWWLWKFRALL